MKRRWIFPLIVVCLGGCIANDSLHTMSSSENNMYNLWRISKGMSECEVIRIMHKPFDYEIFEFDDDVYDVWFYITRVTGLGQTRLVPQNLTPLTFKNGVLVDVGYTYYNYLIKEEQLRAKAAASQQLNIQPNETEDQNENKELEKTLETAPSAPAPYPRKTNAQPATPTAPAPVKSAPKNQKAAPPPPSPTPSSQGKVPQNQLPGNSLPGNQLPGRSSPNAPAPKNQLPGIAPQEPNPAAQPKKNNPVSMCSRIKNPVAEELDEPNSEQQKKRPSNEDREGMEWDSEDERMEEEESEQNFDYW